MKFKCECCGIEQEFVDGDAAFRAGWDVPPYFQHVGCDLCPGVCIVFGIPHTRAHALWAKHGRPDTFNPQTCADDHTWRHSGRLY